MENNKNFKMKPAEFRKILQGITLKNLSLIETSAKIKPGSKSYEKLEIEIKDEAKYNIKDDEVIIIQKYILNGTPIGKKQKILSISVTFALYLESEKEFSDDFFEIYKVTSLPINTWPFLREFANSMTARMNIPPLTLPLLKR